MKTAGRYLGEVSDDEDLQERPKKRKHLGGERPTKRVRRG
jgi:hypothetical protein